MKSKNLTQKMISASRVNIGDRISIETKDLKKEGVLMPHHAFSDENIITIKLDNGYNIGIKVDESTKISLVEKGKKPVKTIKEIPFDKKKPTVSIVGTGGTIACYVEYRTGAVFPASTAEDLAFAVPEIFDIANIKANVAFQIFSEDMSVNHWRELAKIIADELNKGSGGVVVPHGTDTMGYTAAALSFMLKNLSGPVVLVGAQRSSDRPSSDAVQNLLSAVNVAACSDIGEVVVVMHGEISDSYNLIHRGTKVRKFHTSRRDAFKSVNIEPIGKVENGEIKIENKYRKKTKGKVVVDDKICSDVAMVYFYPDLKPEDIPERKGIVLVGTGLGHVSNNIIPRIKQLIREGSIIVMTSQCFFGRLNMNVYSKGRDLLKMGVISCEDMLPETAYVKLMWALGHSKKPDEIKKIMQTNIIGEISDRTKTNCYF